MVTSDLRVEVEILPFRACSIHLAIIIGTVRSLWTWLWGIYHVPQNIFLLLDPGIFLKNSSTLPDTAFFHIMSHIFGTTDDMFMKSLPDMYLWRRKSPLNFGSHLDLDSGSVDF